MLRIGKSIRTESKLLVSKIWKEGDQEGMEWKVAANGNGISFWGNENVLKLIMVESN